jgi:hypothetical protein
MIWSAVEMFDFVGMEAMKGRTTQKVAALPRRVLEVAELGGVVLAKSRRARRLSMTIMPYGGVRVAVPYRMTFAEAEAFVASHVGWARRHLERVERIRKAHESTVAGLPAVGPLEAGRILKDRLWELSRRHGFSYNRVFIRNQKTRWGSCSHQNNINLNINLVRLRPGLMDYVIVHELVHTRIKNHRKRFWAELDKLVGDAKALDKELKQHVLGPSPGSRVAAAWIGPCRESRAGCPCHCDARAAEAGAPSEYGSAHVGNHGQDARATAMPVPPRRAHHPNLANGGSSGGRR